jgi:hypothetical protein
MLPQFPTPVIAYVRRIFASVNRRVSEKMARVPNCSEPSLDLTVIEHLTRFAAPQIVAPGWTVKLDVHYLGGLRHHHRWEVADIGLLVFAKQGVSVVGKKVALLQSKRLYPVNHSVHEEELADYQLGLVNLVPSGPVVQSIATPHKFHFSASSQYKALFVGDEQYKAIQDYESKSLLPVHYLLYNPWTVPATYTIPTASFAPLGPQGSGGCRVVRSTDLRASVASKPNGYNPSFAEMAGLCGTASTGVHGWRLEHFVADLVLRCKEGHPFENASEVGINGLFFRRSGPISAALAITIEGPESYDAEP